jgi:hypothetical protein
MKRIRFTDEQIIAALREQDAGAKPADLSRQRGVSAATLCRLAPFLTILLVIFTVARATPAAAADEKAYQPSSSLLKSGESTEAPMQYHVAISFAGEDREFVRHLVERLKQLGIRVFYDQDEQAKLWGQSNQEFFVDLLMHRTRFCIMVISKHYAAKQWPRLERQAAFARAMQETDVFLLPVRLDDTVLPGLLPTIGYQDARTMSVDDLAALMLGIIQSHPAEATTTAADPHPGSHPTESPVAERLYDEILRY